ncbi:bifunctional molybdopterin-guanine dinucleotide biosynthesis adaptor protein MobB/molybdopterin molybdotransferase MoeA [Halocynthiibacter sp.]|uniref:bifunctional molybdopterin-guanine dinucleotide biosynthesis adaptor protein MobB/molybdopterin molybdotransferase MoeA n=1 Tax=Halocynthiibacter sp. TaxID=1979210 RepID=UPI003C53B8E8
MKIFGVTGWKNAGKTGLMERLIAEFTSRGLRVSSIKHAHHTTDVDQPGRDSYRHREAGAREVFLSSKHRWALMGELRGDDEPSLSELIARLTPCDLVLVEGFKREPHSKVECIRAVNDHPMIAAEDGTIKVIASDAPMPHSPCPVIDLDDTAAIADFISLELGFTNTAAPTDAPAPLKNDCFALPPGVTWTPVDTALAHLRDNLTVNCATETLPLWEAAGRFLATDATALRASPPADNSAVDGYGFAASALTDPVTTLPLSDGRAAAGDPHMDPVPHGQAIRILTGALTPPGVNTVIMEEDVEVADGQIRFQGRIKPGANVRKMGEDITAGALALPAGTRLDAAALGLLTSLGIAEVIVRKPLRVGVLSTGDELAKPGETIDPARTYDANRPMLLELIRSWGHQPVDLGHAPDDRDTLRATLDASTTQADVILTSGGASQGDEDHMSALLTESGAMQLWRIAMKPGRPLALGLWNNTPVFGLPGNPVAAFVTAQMFARPSCLLLAGGKWSDPQSFMLPAAFSKKKKPGRREFQRGKIRPDGAVELFANEGSGRISGLTWADGIVDIAEDVTDITPGTTVRFIPWGSFAS